jgi:hypothetical protein
MAVVGMACLTVGATLFATPAANAQAGRRICEYSGKLSVYGSDSRTVIGSEMWAMDYGKKHSCPKSSNVPGGNVITPIQVTCETFRDDMNLNGDPCPGMINDTIYEVKLYNDGSNPVFINHGHF